jgi:transposase
MVMTVCLLVYAALEYRIRTALKEHDATFPNQTGPPSRTRRRGGSSTILEGLTCYVGLDKGPWC